MILLRDKFAD